MVKASTVARELSKGNLEKRLGSFEPSTLLPDKHNGSRSYNAQPIRTRADTVELYAQYQAEQRGIQIGRTTEWTQLRNRKNRRIEAAKRSGRLKRAAIKLMGGGRTSKKILYSLASKTLKEELKKIGQQYLKERQVIYDTNQRQAWADWLRHKATHGDLEALEALRSRETAQSLKGNTVTGKGRKRLIKKPIPQQDSITKKGTIIYHVGYSTIRDDGKKLKISHGHTQDSLITALSMAIERYGDRIAVNGSDLFKSQIVQAAIAAKLPISFESPDLEHQRQGLLTSTKEIGDNDRYNTNNRGRTNRGSVSGLGSDNGKRNGIRFIRPAGSDTLKPNIGHIGRQPPPQRRNQLRSLPQLGVVRIASRSEVLLPRDVSDHVEHKGTQPDNGVRRGLSRGGLITAVQQAANKYIAEREKKRLNGFDIPKHRMFNDQDAGEATFAGIRHITDHTFILISRNNENLVLPIDETTTRQLKRIAVGDALNVNAKGLIKTKGRSR